MAFFISNIVLGLLDQLQIFLRLYLIELLGLLTRLGGTRAVTLDIFKPFDRVWHAGLLPKVISYGIKGQIFGLISSFLCSRWFQVVLDEQSSQEHVVNAGFS